ncbi:hypothetical protein [Lacrimispora sp.]|uniref:hypothetical protein n=1 Tax=Lacrimispora sp. TaxID=2719234 RepID=UPI0028AA8961|nr:hypothetical protein [Lacrimispora sp.]
MSNIKDLKTTKISDDVVNYLNSLNAGAIKTTTSITGLAKNLGTTNKSAITFTKGIKDGSITLVEGQTYLQGYQSYLKSTSSALSLADIKTKALSVSMKALSTVGWMAIFTVASMAIGKGIEALSNFNKRVENTKNSANELMSAFSSAISKANSNADSIESMSAKYETLAKGVNNLGENVSLTTDEYKEYNDIVNQIADMFPNLINGYTNEGNAIISLKGNVEQLRDAYKDAQKEAYNMLVASGKGSDGNDIIKNYQNVVSGFNGIYAQDEMGAKQIVDMLTDLNSSFGDTDKFKSVLKEFQKLASENNEAYHSKEFQGILDDIGINDLFGSISSINSLDDDHLSEASNKIAEHFSKIKSTIQTYQAEIDTVLNNTKTLANAYLMTNEDYEKLDDQSKNAASIIVNSINEGIASGFSSKEDVGAYVQEILDTINSNPEVKESMVGLFTLNYSDMPIEQSSEIINQYINYIAKILGEDPLELKIRLGFNDFNDLETQYRNAIESAKKKFGQDETDFFSKNSINSQEEIDNWLKIAQGANSATEAERLYLEQSKKSVPVSSKEEVIANVNSLSEGFESLDKIMSSMKDKNPFDFSLLDDKKFKDSFNGLGEAYTNFIETVSDSPKDVKGAQSAFNDLTTAWIDSKLALNGYTEENTNLIASMLKNMGVTNAEELVASRLANTQEHLAAQKAYTADMSDALANATANEIPGLIDEATQSDIAKVALAGLALEKANANGTALDTSGDIENVISLVDVIGTASTALRNYNKLKSGQIFDVETQKVNRDKLFSTGFNAGQLGQSAEEAKQLEDYNKRKEDLKNASEKEMQDAAKAARAYMGKGTQTNVIYGGANKSNKAGSDKKKKDETKNDVDWIARGTKVLQDEYAKLEELANKDTVAYLGLTQEQFDKAKSIFDNGLGNTTEGLSELQSFADKAGLSLGEFYTMIQSGAPSASKENALQGMLKMQTETLLPQYQQEVDAYTKAYADALKAVPEYKDKIENGGVKIESLPSDLGKKVQAAIDANEKLKSSEKQLEEGREKQIQTIKELHENRISAIDIENEKLEQSNKIIKSQMDLMEARGEIIDADFYKQQKSNNKGLISGNQQNIAEWESEMADLRASNVSVKSKDYKELQAKVKAAKNEIQGLELEQEECNQALEQMPIDNLNTIVSMYKDISSAIENWGNVASATGEKLNADYYQTLISNGATTIDQYQELASEIENVMDNQKEGSTRWNELYGQLQSVNSEMSSMVQNLQKWNEELLKMPLENINNYTSELQKVADGLSGVKGEYDTAISAVTGAIKEQIDTINEQKNAVNEEYDAQKKALQDKLDLLNKQNKELQLQQKYEQALYNLQKANQQATEKVIRDGQVVYEQNADKLRDAQEAVQDAKFDMETDKIQTQIDELQETLDGLNEKYQNQIDSLQKISDKWSEISEKITQAQNEAKANDLLGVGWKDKVLSGKDVELFNNFSGMYANTAEQLRQYQEQINTTNNIYSLLEDYITSYKEGTLSYDQALTGINNLLAQMNQTMSAEGNIQNIYDYLGAMNGTAANAENVLSGIKQGLANTATELIDSFKQYNQNAGLISEYTSSWQQLTDNVSSMLRVLEEVRDNLESASDGDDDEDEDDDSDGPSRTGSSGYVNSGPGAKSKSDDPIWDLIDDKKKATSRKDGITRGLVGSSSGSDREAKMKLLGLQKMDQDEISAILHKNEAVFNPEQQDMLLKNLATAWNFTPSKIDYTNLSSGHSNLTTQEFKFGNINIQECNDTERLADGILNGGLKSAIIQQLGKR